DSGPPVVLLAGVVMPHAGIARSAVTRWPGSPGRSLGGLGLAYFMRVKDQHVTLDLALADDEMLTRAQDASRPGLYLVHDHGSIVITERGDHLHSGNCPGKTAQRLEVGPRPRCLGHRTFKHHVISDVPGGGSNVVAGPCPGERDRHVDGSAVLSHMVSFCCASKSGCGPSA